MISFRRKSVKDLQAMRAAELEFYEKHAPRLVKEPPACTLMQVVSLAKPEFLVEFEATAVVQHK
jgi:enamine deaminase RidA (YjgF/YER057c/UK114 family)